MQDYRISPDEFRRVIAEAEDIPAALKKDLLALSDAELSAQWSWSPGTPTWVKKAQWSWSPGGAPPNADHPGPADLPGQPPPATDEQSQEPTGWCRRLARVVFGMGLGAFVGGLLGSLPSSAGGFVAWCFVQLLSGNPGGWPLRLFLLVPAVIGGIIAISGRYLCCSVSPNLKPR